MPLRSVVPFRHIDADQQHEVPATAAPLPDGFTRMTKDDHSFLVVHMRDHTSFKQRLLKRQNDRNIVGKDGESLYFLKADYTGDGFTGMTLHRGRDDACPLVARYVGGTRHHGMTIQLAMPGNFGHTLPVKSTSSHPFKISLTFVTQLPSGAAAQWTVSGTDGSCKCKLSDGRLVAGVSRTRSKRREIFVRQDYMRDFEALLASGLGVYRYMMQSAYEDAK